MAKLDFGTCGEMAELKVKLVVSNGAAVFKDENFIRLGGGFGLVSAMLSDPTSGEIDIKSIACG